MLKPLNRSLIYIATSLIALTLLSACSSNQSQRPNNYQSSDSKQNYTLISNDFSSLQKAQALSLAQGYTYQGQFTPYLGSKARIYGSTSSGCIEGSSELNDHQTDFQLQRWALGRNYAHPLMMQYLADLRQRTKEQGLPPLLIGDLSNISGGPFGVKSNHASHNTGIDVDLPFDFASPRKTKAQLSSPKDVYIVLGKQIQPSFTKDIVKYIKLSASDPRVDRIFVAPMIKKHMCDLYANQEDNGFLSKLRPWFGHQAHMHVRLKCPFDSPDCIAQAPVPSGTGCGSEVESWFIPAPKDAKAKAKKKERILPQKCALILNNSVAL